MKHNANVVVDNFINIKFCIHQSAASSPARDEALGEEGRSVCLSVDAASTPRYLCWHS